MPALRTRLKVSLTAALLALAQMSAALADGAVVMTSAICDNPRDAIDTLWVSSRFGANDVFYMRADTNQVVAMSAAVAFDARQDIYVVSHGNEDDIGPFAKAQFAANLFAAHPSLPASVYFDSCNAASGVQTVLAETNQLYGNQIPALYGPQGPCQLVGNGNPDVASAENRYDAGLQPGNQFAAVADNIMTVWTTQPYAASGMTWQAACETYANAADMPNLDAFRLAVQHTFLNAPVYPIGESHNYGLLIQWNTGGQAFFQCGLANAVACP
ncbi:hypothetical protein [Pannonibacter tanglangensis]|uniref:DUF4347 domain-containing protein n=1 Tax=Pannonibacter tanglangensis TaxID=2750084 RepID=A0ABW9ZH51_9HYPH|nr:hypothetical protein [Pannonibacter sp. XCT-34]NBN62357.1 hypothetical protein [Pannonibacter sp. XCT-34]